LSGDSEPAISSAAEVSAPAAVDSATSVRLSQFSTIARVAPGVPLGAQDHPARAHLAGDRLGVLGQRSQRRQRADQLALEQLLGRAELLAMVGGDQLRRLAAELEPGIEAAQRALERQQGADRISIERGGRSPCRSITSITPAIAAGLRPAVVDLAQQHRHVPFELAHVDVLGVADHVADGARDQRAVPASRTRARSPGATLG